MSKPVLPLKVRDRVREYAVRPVSDPPLSGLVGALVGTFNLAVGGTDNRQIIFGWFFTPDDQIMQPMSSKELSAAQVFGLKRWVGAALVGEPSSAQKWINRADFEIEAKWVVARATQAYSFTNKLMERYNRVIMMRELRLLEASENWWPPLTIYIERDDPAFERTLDVALEVVLTGKEVKPPQDYQLQLPETEKAPDRNARDVFASYEDELLEFING